MNPTAYRSMRDHIHPPRVSAPSCIIPPTEDVAVRPYLVPLLPTYHGMENENPYTHIRDFEEVCTTFKEGMMDMDLLTPLQLKMVRGFTSAGRDSWRPSVHAHTMGLIHGCW